MEGYGDFVATFGVNNAPISYMSNCSFLVHGGLLDTGSCSSVADDLVRFLN